jgi:hypothetical protein
VKADIDALHPSRRPITNAGLQCHSAKWSGAGSISWSSPRKANEAVSPPTSLALFHVVLWLCLRVDCTFGECSGRAALLLYVSNKQLRMSSAVFDIVSTCRAASSRIMYTNKLVKTNSNWPRRGAIEAELRAARVPLGTVLGSVDGSSS